MNSTAGRGGLSRSPKKTVDAPARRGACAGGNVRVDDNLLSRG
jgi:hypothetical protein